MKRFLLALLCLLVITPLAANAQSSKKQGSAKKGSAAKADGSANKSDWVQLFDGKSFAGWKANENKESWKIVDGAFVCKGDRSHLFYTGDQAPFKNFHFKCSVLTKPNANAGIYFHTKYQETGWPKYGFEAQVNNTQGDHKRTGSLYDVVNVLETHVKDNVWFTEEIIVNGKNIKIVVDGKTVVDYDEPADQQPGKDFQRIIGSGTFAFQAHDPGSEVHFKDIMVKKLD